jgi:O-antigen/teichoic acid export membrane protein
MHSLITSKKVGIVASYLMIACNTVSSIVLVPFYLKFLGVDGYGFYQMIYSVASYILILDFGIGTTMVRFLTEYRVKNDKKGAQNFAAHCGFLILIIDIAIVIVGLILSCKIGYIYPTLTPDKIELGTKMFRLMIAVLVMTVTEHFMEGITMAYDSFSVAKLIGVFKLLVKFVLVLLFLYDGQGVESLVYVDVLSELGVLILYSLFNFGYIKFKIKLHNFDLNIFKPMATFMFAIMLQSIVAYLNNTVDKTILGIMLGETASGIYGLSMTFITMFNMIPTVILTIFLPQATKMVIQGESMEKHTQMASLLGRYQMIVCGGILSLFAVLGMDFIHLWAGENEKEIWLTALIIMIPNAIPLIQNYCLNVLDAMNKRLFRSIVLLGISGLNIVLTIVMVKEFGVLGAPISTAFSYVIGHGIVINIYYKKVIGIGIGKMWKTILSRLLPCVIVTTIITYPLNFYENINYISFAVKAVIWAAVYGLLLLLFGFNKSEKLVIKNLIDKVCLFVKNKGRVKG